MRMNFTVTVEADTQEQCEQVITERVNFTEDYGFDYMVTWSRPVADCLWCMEANTAEDFIRLIQEEEHDDECPFAPTEENA